METSPSTTEMTIEQIQERLAQIDQAHFALTESLNRAPAEFQESSHPDDDATEGESVEQKLGAIRSQIQELEHERDQLHAQLARLKDIA